MQVEMLVWGAGWDASLGSGGKMQVGLPLDAVGGAVLKCGFGVRVAIRF